MSLNLHAMVRGAINTVNADMAATYRASTGYTTNPDGTRVPSYAADVAVTAQVQALSGRDLQHPDFLNVQGIVRAVYMFGNVQGVARPDAKGGDLLLFPQTVNGPARTWLVVAVLETWTPDAAGWCKLGVVLQ